MEFSNGMFREKCSKKKGKKRSNVLVSGSVSSLKCLVATVH